jgi:hypothetical protein
MVPGSVAGGKAPDAAWPAAALRVAGEVELLVVTEDYDLFDTVFVDLVTFDVFEAVLFFIDVTRIAIVGVFRRLRPG